MAEIKDVSEESTGALKKDTTEVVVGVSDGKSREVNSTPAVVVVGTSIVNGIEGRLVTISMLESVISKLDGVDVPGSPNVSDGASNEVDEEGEWLTDTADVTSTEDETTMSDPLGN